MFVFEEKSLSLPSWFFSTIVNPFIPMVFISIDFIIDLPPSSSYDSILMVVDLLTKMAHFFPCTKTTTNEGITKFFFDHVFQYHGFLEDIISNCGPQFTFKL
jgi:hypothetical protein